MANVGVFESGYEAGAAPFRQRRALKMAHAEEEREDRRNELHQLRTNIQAKLSALPAKKDPATGKELELSQQTPEYQQAYADLMKANQALMSFNQPAPGPGVLREIGEKLHKGAELVHLAKTPAAQPPGPRISAGTVEPGTEAAVLPANWAGPGAALPAQTAYTVKGPMSARPTSVTMAVPKPKGLVEPGNLPIWNRPVVQNPDGSHSTELSFSREENGKEVLVPSIVNGKFLTPDGKMPPMGHEDKNGKYIPTPQEQAMYDRAWDHYKKTGENLGKFDSPESADAYAQILHNRGAHKTPGQLKALAQTATKEVAVPSQPSVPVQPTAQQAPEAGPTALAAEPAYRPVSPAPPAAAKPTLLPKQLRAQAELRRRAAEETEQQVAALPASENEINKYRKELIEGGFSPEDAEKEVRRKFMPEPKEPTEKFMPTLTTTIDEAGKTHYWRVPLAAGEAPEEVDFKGQKIEPKASTSQFNEMLASYAKQHKMAVEELPPNVYDYVACKMALDRAIPSSTTTTTIKLDAEGNYVPVTITNYRTPGGKFQLVDPLGTTEEQKTGAEKAPLSTKKTTERTEKAKQTSPAATGKGEGAGNVRVGPALFKGRSSEATAANKNVDIAQNSLLDVQKASQDPTPVGDQGIVLAWLRGRVNRVTATEIAAVNNLGGAQLKMEANLVRIASGKMTDQQRNWFLQSAQNNYDNAVTVANKYKTGGVSAPQAGGGGEIPKGW